MTARAAYEAQREAALVARAKALAECEAAYAKVPTRAALAKVEAAYDKADADLTAALDAARDEYAKAYHKANA